MNTKRTIDLNGQSDKVEFHGTLIRSCVEEYTRLHNISTVSVSHFKEYVLPWIFLEYGVKYNLFLDDDNYDPVTSVTITNEQKYTWYLLKHSIWAIYENNNN
jgi:hypothetical protein